jgi:hypothetical protein
VLWKSYVGAPAEPTTPPSGRINQIPDRDNLCRYNLLLKSRTRVTVKNRNDETVSEIDDFKTRLQR